MKFLLTNQTRKKIRIKYPNLFLDKKTHFINIEYIINKNNLWNVENSPEESLNLFFIIHNIIEKIHLSELEDGFEHNVIYKIKNPNTELIMEIIEYFNHNRFHITNFFIIPNF